MAVVTESKTIEIDHLIWIDPERMSGVPCFFGTRVPVKNLFDYLEGGETIEAFLGDFEGVSREQVDEVLRLAMDNLLEQLKPS